MRDKGGKQQLPYAPTQAVGSTEVPEQRIEVAATVAAPEAPQRHTPLPDLGPKLRVLGILGRGGMGTVFRARHLRLDRDVAVKTLDRKLIGEGGVFVERFRREARVAAQLNHRHIVIIHDFAVSPDGVPYIEMELLSGESLRETLAREAPLPLRRVVELLRGVADALDCVHAAGIYHRDLKPENLFVTNDGTLKILDFGIIHLVTADEKLTGTGDLLGTPRYMAPEQLTGQPTTGATDVYALGLIAYEMLTGGLPFGGGSLSDIMRRVSEPPPLANQIRHDLSSAAGSAVHKALAANPADRWPRASDLIDGLTAALPGQVAPEGATPLPARPVMPRSWARRGMAAVLAVLAVTAGVGWVLHHHTEPGDAGIEAGHPQRPIRLLVVPFDSRADREVDKRVWPLTDRILLNLLADLDVGRHQVERVDPLLVAREMVKREMTVPLSADHARELAMAFGSDAWLEGTITRTGGLVRVNALWTTAHDGRQERFEGSGADAFAAVRELTSRLPLSGVFGSGAGSTAVSGTPTRSDGASVDESLWHFVPGSHPPADDVAAGWASVLGDPWSEAPYGRFAKSAALSRDPDLQGFSATLAQGRRPEVECEAPAAILSARYPRSMGALALAVCAHRRLKMADAVEQAERAFDDLALRPLAAAFLAKTFGQAHDRKALIRFHEKRAGLFPDDADAWSLLATMYAEDGRTEDGTACMQVAEARYDPGRDGFRVALNGARFAVRTEQLATAGSWLDKLTAATPAGDSDVMFRALLHATILRLRGRFGEAAKVLEGARAVLAANPSEPYTEVATTLFYAYLAGGDFERAAAVADEYARLYPAEDSPDHWAAALLRLALDKQRARVSGPVATRRSLELAERFEKTLPESGKRYRDGVLCLWQSYGGDDAAASELLLQAEPDNTLVAGCRYAAARRKAREGKYADARALFQRARSNMLFRANWYIEMYLPALAGEADAAMRSGDARGARSLYEQIVSQYADADKDLPELTEARTAVARSQE